MNIIIFLRNMEDYQPDNKTTDICKYMLKMNNVYKMEQ